MPPKTNGHMWPGKNSNHNEQSSEGENEPPSNSSSVVLYSAPTGPVDIFQAEREQGIEHKLTFSLKN